MCQTRHRLAHERRMRRMVARAAERGRRVGNRREGQGCMVRKPMEGAGVRRDDSETHAEQFGNTPLQADMQVTVVELFSHQYTARERTIMAAIWLQRQPASCCSRGGAQAPMARARDDHCPAAPLCARPTSPWLSRSTQHFPIPTCRFPCRHITADVPCSPRQGQGRGVGQCVTQWCTHDEAQSSEEHP